MAGIERIIDLVKGYFKIDERNSSISQEIRAGIATFLTMSYILLVNPQLLGKLGVPPTDVVVSTAIASFMGTLISGLSGNLPFGLAPGVGLSAYLTYGLIEGDGLTLSQAFTSCLLAGIILLVFSVTGVSQLIMVIIPHSVKIGTIVGMGLQIAIVGMTSIDLVVGSNFTLITLGDLANYKIWVSIFGLLIIGTLSYHKVRGGILIGILIISILTWYLESSFPHKFVTLPTLTLGHADYINFSELEFGKCFSAVVAFVFIGIIDVSGVMFGMARLANLTLIDDTVPGSMYAFVGVSVSTVLGACMGSTPVIIYVESAAGIKEGGRTGLTAVVISFFFVLSLFLAPLFSSIPVTATSSVSILVGVLMMSQAREIDWDDLSSAIPAFLTMTLIPFTFSITNGIMFGLLAALFFYFSTGKVIKDLERFSNHPHINRSSLGYITVPEQSVHSELFQVVHGNDHFEIAEPASTCSITSSPEDGRVNIM